MKKAQEIQNMASITKLTEALRINRIGMSDGKALIENRLGVTRHKIPHKWEGRPTFSDGVPGSLTTSLGEGESRNQKPCEPPAVGTV